MTAPELKPCPFCGGKPYLANVEMVGCAYVVCTDCRVQGDDASRESAIAAWNHRADLAAVPAQVRVKPLVWEEPCYTNNWIHVARSVFGDYYISIDGGRHSAWLEANVKPYENKIGDEVGSVIEAMMLAEADYQARMQPLITPLPDQTVEIDLRVAMMEELEKAASESLWVPEEYYMNEVISDCCAFLRSDRSQPDPRDEVIARLVEENNWQIKARAQHWLRRTISAPEDAAVEEICEKYGYGAVMDAASRLWARKPYGSGAFYVGGCIGFKSDDEARAALAAAKAV